MAGPLQYPVFCLSVGHLILGDNDVFPQHFDGVEVARALLSTKDYLAECALT